MISSQRSTPPITSGPSSRVGGLNGNRIAREDSDPSRPEPGGSSEATELNRDDVSLIVFAKEPLGSCCSTPRAQCANVI